MSLVMDHDIKRWTASRAIGECYNHQRPHPALKMKTPAQAYALAA